MKKQQSSVVIIGFLLIFVSGIALQLGVVSIAEAQRRNLVPRTVLALYDSRVEKEITATTVHRLFELPLNYLGLIVKYHDLQSGLPDLSKSPNVRGVLTCFPYQTIIKNPTRYLRWAEGVLDAGKKFVIFENPGFLVDAVGEVTSLERINSFYRRLGWIDTGRQINFPYSSEITFKDRLLLDFERPIERELFPYRQIKALKKQADSFLTLSSAADPQASADLVIASPRGGYVSQAYAFYHFADHASGTNYYQWYIDPFSYFRLVFATDQLPKADTTTLAGRRIFYSMVNGDGFLNPTEVEKYQNRPALAAEVVLEQVISKIQDFPFTISLIAAEFDPHWIGTTASQQTAMRLFELVNTEAGSRTYSSPYNWAFFAEGDPAEENSFLELYKRQAVWENLTCQDLGCLMGKFWRKISPATVSTDIRLPRAYASFPFELEREIKGSVEFLSGILSQGKTIKLFSWTGSKLPSGEIIRKVRELNLDSVVQAVSRKDSKFRSYAHLLPLGILTEEDAVIYDPVSTVETEGNGYFGSWQGFLRSRKTVTSTNTPLRIKPHSISFSLGFGEKQPYISALLDGFEFARQQQVVPIFGSEFAAIAQGFYSAQFSRLGNKIWKVLDRGELQTLRFDHSSQAAVDFQRSQGIVGQQYLQGSLYVYLDQSVAEPVVAIADRRNSVSIAYLIDSRWPVWNLERSSDSFSFLTKGFGKGAMTWHLPWKGHAHLTFQPLGSAVAGSRQLVTESATEGKISFELDGNYNQIYQVVVSRREKS